MKGASLRRMPLMDTIFSLDTFSLPSISFFYFLVKDRERLPKMYSVNRTAGILKQGLPLERGTDGIRDRLHDRRFEHSPSNRTRVGLPSTPSPRPYAKQSIDRYAQRQPPLEADVPTAERKGSTIMNDIWAKCKNTAKTVCARCLDILANENELHWTEFEPEPEDND